MARIYDERVETSNEFFGCGYCWDKRKKKSIDLFFLDRANNMRACTYCPACGRDMSEEPPNE